MKCHNRQQVKCWNNEITEKKNLESNEDIIGNLQGFKLIGRCWQIVYQQKG